MITKVLLIAAGGALGSLLRAGLSLLVQRNAGTSFPWGTAAVNVIGCFLFGLGWALTESRAQPTFEVRLLVLTGFMGAFTTFSTYMFECTELASSGRYGAMAANLLLQNAVGFGCLILGLSLGRAATA